MIKIIMLLILGLVVVSGCAKEQYSIFETVEYKENKTATMMETKIEIFNEGGVAYQSNDIFCIVYFEEKFIICNDVE